MDVEVVLGTASENVKLSMNNLIGFPARAISVAMKTYNWRLAHLWLLNFDQVSSVSMAEAGVVKAMTAYW